jgi:hypothetical protein
VTHVSGDDLERYSMLTVEEPEMGRIEEHLLVCARCRNRLHDTDEYVAAMTAAAAESERGRKRQPSSKM